MQHCVVELVDADLRVGASFPDTGELGRPLALRLEIHNPNGEEGANVSFELVDARGFMVSGGCHLVISGFRGWGLGWGGQGEGVYRKGVPQTMLAGSMVLGARGLGAARPVLGEASPL